MGRGRRAPLLTRYLVESAWCRWRPQRVAPPPQNVRRGTRRPRPTTNARFTRELELRMSAQRARAEAVLPGRVRSCALRATRALCLAVRTRWGRWRARRGDLVRRAGREPGAGDEGGRRDRFRVGSSPLSACTGCSAIFPVMNLFVGERNEQEAVDAAALSRRDRAKITIAVLLFGVAVIADETSREVAFLSLYALMALAFAWQRLRPGGRRLGSPKGPTGAARSTGSR